MSQKKQIKKALISVFNKENLDRIVEKLDELNIEIFSTGGTQSYIEAQGSTVSRVEDLTSYPSILGGRVKTLHPKVFGGILSRRELDSDVAQLEEYEIPEIDLVIVDLYPFEDTVASGADHSDIIEKIDIGGISLIRAAAKNYKDVVIVSSKNQYQGLLDVLTNNNGETTLGERKDFAKEAFNISSHYDSKIFGYFSNNDDSVLKESILDSTVLRYGENPHQKGVFYGKLDELFDKLHGKELSYNNLLDVDAAVNLMQEFKNEGPTFAILKHNNACGLAIRPILKDAYLAALAGDPVSSFGGILISNTVIDIETAEEINKLFCEVVIAPQYDAEALELLKSKKNRIILIQKEVEFPKTQIRTLLNGVLFQEKDNKTDKKEDFVNSTEKAPTTNQLEDLEFGEIEYNSYRGIRQVVDDADTFSGMGDLEIGATFELDFEKENENVALLGRWIKQTDDGKTEIVASEIVWGNDKADGFYIGHTVKNTVDFDAKIILEIRDLNNNLLANRAVELY